LRIGLISDTHSFIHPEVLVLFTNVDLILHAGDIGNEDVLISLERFAPVQAVLGNMDAHTFKRQLTEICFLTAEEKNILMMHKPPRIYDKNPTYSLRKKFSADIIIHGHTHIPRNEKRGDVLLLNPGSAGSSRVTSNPSVALLELRQGTEPKVEIIHLASLPG